MSTGLSRSATIHRSGDWIPRVSDRLTRFFFPSASSTWLAVLRIGLAVQVLLYCVALRRDWNQLFGGQAAGFLNREFVEAVVRLKAAFVPTLGWAATFGRFCSIPEETTVWIVWCGLLCAAGCLLIGVFCRSGAIVTWLLYVATAKSGSLLAYGVDYFTTIGLFYLMLAPLPDRYAFDHRVRSILLKDRHLHGFFRRVLQLHLCIIYFCSGLTKSLGVGWWNGDSLWRALTRPPFDLLPVDLVLSGRALLPAAGIAIVVLEMGYPVFIWLRKTRVIWLIAVGCMHLAIGLTMGLYLFALIMIVLNLAAFGPGIIWPERTTAEVAEAHENSGTRLPC